MVETAEVTAWPGSILHLTTTESTQDLAKEMAQQGSPEWTLVLTESQTQGRGRMGRRWASPKGGLYFSLILRPQISPRRLGDLSLSAAQAAARAVVLVTGLETAVKPPNDVLARPRSTSQSWKKVCGILIEASGGFDRTEWVVLGLGMNVNNPTPVGLPNAGSLKELCRRPLNVELVRTQVLMELRSAYQLFINRSDE